jgi:prepilin-type N-terminal cleavage/methylation domain-containing protein/prepilin-type processing-associated H-X9-DG protein
VTRSKSSSVLKQQAFTLKELLAVVAVVAVLMALLIPFLTKSKADAERIHCNNYLKQIGIASRLFAGDHGERYSPQVSTNQGGSKEFVTSSSAFEHFKCMSNELSTPYILACPNDTRRPVTNFLKLSNSNVSYFMSVDANELLPQMFLAGDRNLIVDHKPAGPGLVSLTDTNTLTWADTIHYGRGNIGLADGSVRILAQSNLIDILKYTGTNLNRLAVP